MKYLVILGDGMADYIIPELGDKTPLQYAYTPYIDLLAKKAVIGQVNTIPPGFPPGSDVANLSVMGYDPSRYYTGRSPLEAVSMGVEMGDEDLALRCNLVCLSTESEYSERKMLDYSAGEIDTRDSAVLLQLLEKELGSASFNFYPGISYRHLLLWKNGLGREIILTPPHDISGRPIKEYLPQGRDSAPLLEIMRKSSLILQQHPLYRSRLEAGHNPATSVWFWGEGSKPSLPSFQEKFALHGSVVAAVDLVKGLGISAGLKPVSVAGATGGIVTNFAGKARAALNELKQDQDFVYLHIESPDEAGHQGNLEKKIWSIEQLDKEVVSLVVKEMDEFEELRVLILPDHPTPLTIQTHSSEPVPFLFFDKNRPQENPAGVYDEINGSQGMIIEQGHELMDFFIRGKL
ncbi:cofactor-independent phosphoglycerate mutase [Syntrophomonas wolfei]|mgnify:CR=1 FL=1|uniref:cofactor-independent phosphoglycerate mutase n=1 Tax=Syntrophomonas wolfei TaxID=863 RepID=UPI0007748DFF|nr:cofactor-independent phosphoglycerate mutase [Syntrophomonas wolfei]